MAPLETLGQKVRRTMCDIENCECDFLRVGYLKDLFSLLEGAPVLLAELFPRISRLCDTFYPMRELVVCMMADKIGLQNLECLPETIRRIKLMMRDPDHVCRGGTTSGGIHVFVETFKKIALEGPYYGDNFFPIVMAATDMISLRDDICYLLQDRKLELEVVDLVKEIIILWTPSPDCPSKPDFPLPIEELLKGFNIAWLFDGHLLFDALHLFDQAKQLMARLLDELRFAVGKPTTYVMRIISGLSMIADERCEHYYLQIVEILTKLDPRIYSQDIDDIDDLTDELKNALELCLRSTCSAATLWNDRVVEALIKVDHIHDSLHDRPLTEDLSVMSSCATALEPADGGTEDSSDASENVSSLLETVRGLRITKQCRDR